MVTVYTDKVENCEVIFKDNIGDLKDATLCINCELTEDEKSFISSFNIPIKYNFYPSDEKGNVILYYKEKQDIDKKYIKLLEFLAQK